MAQPFHPSPIAVSLSYVYLLSSTATGTANQLSIFPVSGILEADVVVVSECLLRGWRFSPICARPTATHKSGQNPPGLDYSS